MRAALDEEHEELLRNALAEVGLHPGPEGLCLAVAAVNVDGVQVLADPPRVRDQDSLVESLRSLRGTAAAAVSALVTAAASAAAFLVEPSWPSL